MALVEYKSDQGSGSSGSDSDQGSQFSDSSSSDSQGSNKRRKTVPASTLQDHEVGVQGPVPSGLPSALSALDALEGPPTYLTPEATRPLASSAYHGRLVQSAKASNQDGNAQHVKRDKKTGYAPGEWDITKMAPKLKGQAPAAPAGVVSAAPVRYKTDDRVDSSIVTAAQVAMLGGQWASKADAAEDGDSRSGPQPALAADSKPKRRTTSAMGVTDFLDKGHGGAQLPRKKQDRKDMERSKRERGQSSHSAWKSEAEMVLRQQYD